jgi:hypothetical protein
MFKRILGAVLAVALVGATALFVYPRLKPEATCAACYRAIHGETHVVAHLEDGSTADVCCPRCALRFQKERGDVTSVDVTDFRTMRRLDAKDAFFVEDSTVVMCRHDERVQEDRSGVQYELTWDRCLPSLIAFASRDDAVAFRNESGGVVKTYAELLQEDF